MSSSPSFKEVQSLVRVLNEDVDKSIVKLKAAAPDDIDFYARSYIRAYASWVEGFIWIHKTMISRAEYEWYRKLPTESQLFLFEGDWKLTNSGKPKLTTRKIGARENLKGFFVVMSQLFDDFEVNLSDAGWANVLYFYEIRDRLMHPNGSRSLNLTDSDLNTCDRGRLWLKNQFAQLGESVLRSINA